MTPLLDVNPVVATGSWTCYVGFVAVTGVPAEFREPLLTQVDRIVRSEVFRDSESLCQLLNYLAAHATGESGPSLKEHQIATEVFGRPADFDPRMDSKVRVQTSRLRAKLAEYYAGPGADDPMIVEIPRGVYSVTVHPRVVPKAPPAAQAVGELAPGGWRIGVWVLSAVCVLLSISLSFAVHIRPAAQSPPNIPPGLKVLWQGFLDAPDRTWIAFSNAEFVGRPATGMRYLDKAKGNSESILDDYTGTGEVMAIHDLDELFAQFHHEVLAKRALFLTIDDVTNNDTIFVGSPSENLTLRQMPSTQEFVFRRADSGPRKGDLGIVNLHPLPGEKLWSFASPANAVLTEDSAIIGLMPGPTNEHWVMILAGTTTIGTQAAVEYVCSETSVEQLLKRTGRTGADVMPFEALIHVKISHDAPVSTEIIAVHTRAS